ncbi:hypothetical protein V8Z81_31945 (plasmid) [Priestia megaterium]|uniref:hypothetical protein n=1 Tax=Priestia megaterium TaxID=1404 RepID=UPI0030CA9935
MLKRFGIGLLLIFFLCSIPHQAYADAGLSKQGEKKPPKDPNSLNEEEKKEVSKLKKDLQDLYEEYFKKVSTSAEKELNEKYMEQDDSFVRDGIVKTIVERAATEKYEKTYFGEPNVYEDGSFGKLSQKLWKYGIIVEFDREKGGLFDSCTKKDYTIVGDGLCEGVPSFTYSYKNKKLSYTVPKLQFLNGKNTEEKKKNEYPMLLTSEGLFTKPEILEEKKCDIEDVSKKFEENKHIGEPDLGTSKDADSLQKLTLLEHYTDKVGKEMQQTFRSLIGSLDKHFFGTNCDQNSVSVLGQLTNISKPLNITDSRLIMAVSHIMTQISFAFTIVIIAFFSLMFTTGYQNLNPIKFGINLFFCLITINYLPYLTQDLLNLNNKIVHELSSIHLNLDPQPDDDGNPIETIGGQPVDLLSGSLNGMFSTLLEKTNNTDELLLLILLLVIMFFSLIPLLRLILWWYFRMIKIALMVCVGPFMILTLCMPQTSSYGKRWISNLVGEVFSQFFVSIGLLMISVLISNIGEVSYTNHFGWFGVFLFLLSCVFALSELPHFAKTLVDGVTQMGEAQASSTGYRMGRSGQMRTSDISRGIVKGLGGKTSGRTAAGKAVNKVAKSVPSGGGNLIRGMQGKSRSQSPGLSGRVGHSIGGGLNKVGLKTGKTMQKIADKTGAKVSVGSPSGIGAGKAVGMGVGAGFVASKAMSMSSPNKRFKMSDKLMQTGTGTGVNGKTSDLNKKSQQFQNSNGLNRTMSQNSGTLDGTKNRRSSLFGNTSVAKKEQEKPSNSSFESTKSISPVQQRINQTKEQVRDFKKRQQEENKKKGLGSPSSIGMSGFSALNKGTEGKPKTKPKEPSKETNENKQQNNKKKEHSSLNLSPPNNSNSGFSSLSPPTKTNKQSNKGTTSKQPTKSREKEKKQASLKPPIPPIVTPNFQSSIQPTKKPSTKPTDKPDEPSKK